MWTALGLWALTVARAAPPASAAADAPVIVLAPGSPEAAQRDAVAATLGAPLPERIAAISATLLGVPYVVDPAGEGEGIDPDPPGRLDGLDCLTFVEEVLSLAWAPSAADAGRVRRSLRYGAAAPTHAGRRHFMETEWLPGVIADGWLVDRTAAYGDTVRLERTLTVEDYASWRARSGFPHGEDRLPVGRVALDVLPLPAARAVAAEIAPGTVLVIVRVERAGSPFWVSHLGFVVGAPRVFRHASQRASGQRVRDDRLDAYLAHLATYATWPVAGVILLEPVEQGPPRVSPAASP